MTAEPEIQDGSMSSGQMTAVVECEHCKCKRVAVYPVGTPELECPECGEMTGIESPWLDCSGYKMVIVMLNGEGA